MTTATASPLLDTLNTQILPKVFKPGRYLGMEQGAFNKPWGSVKARMALAFPDVYEIGASSYAIKLLYSVVNNHPDYLCDRVYAPAEDMRAELKAHDLPLYGVESKRAVADFDVVAVSLQYELNYTTALGVIDAAQLPLRAADRTEEHPVVLGGGPGSSNPNPLLPFFDGFMVGDGEELLIEVMDVMAKARALSWSRDQRLKALADLEGIYVPGYNDYAAKRIVDIKEHKITIAPLIPAVEAIHDRVTVEARRGCDRMCRFCQPAFVNLPAREKDVDQIRDEMLERLQQTGYEECSLLSLSIADYSKFKPLVQEVAAAVKEENASLSLSSQRADRFSLDVAEAVQTVRKSTLTFAPEAGTPRLRDVINKNLTDSDIMNAVTTAYRGGWNKVKLYYMIGLPSETQADLDGIVHTVKRLREACRMIARDRGEKNPKQLEINVTLSNFVPKPHTPFQWHAQDTIESLNEKIAYLKDALKKAKGVKANFTDPEISKLEAVISKGGIELADVLEAAYRKGAYLDAWGETKPFAKWFEALEEAGIDVEAYTRNRLVDPSDALPWDCIDVGLEKAWLRQEWERSLKAASTTPCFEACSVCGVCSTFNVWPEFTNTVEKEQIHAQPIAAPEKPEYMTLLPVERWRIRLKKVNDLRFISHLDWMRMIHRAVRRANLPIAYTQGFNPKPKVSFGPPLPLFSQGLNEAVDLYFREPLRQPAEVLVARLNEFLPEDSSAFEAVEVTLQDPSIDSAIQAIEYTVQWTCADPGSGRMMQERLAWFLSQDSVELEVETKRGSKRVDLRPGIESAALCEDGTTLTFINRPSLSSEGLSTWVKPAWLLQTLWTKDSAPAPHWQVTRSQLYLARS